MERLTEWYDDGEKKGILVKEYPAENSMKTLYQKFGNQTDYSDTDEGYLCAERLKEYEDFEEQGLLLKLPCKVGDTVYLHVIVGVDRDKRKPILKVIEGKIIKYTIDAVTLCFFVEEKDCCKIRNELPISAFGETVFLTKEEAEQALAKFLHT